MKKFLELNGVTYEVIYVDAFLPKYRKSLFRCYKSCSNHKLAVYEYWKSIAEKFDYMTDFGIDSYNSNIITIGYDVIHPELGFIRAHITPSHNYLYIIKD